MKTKLLLIFFCFSSAAFGQRYGDVWQFGNHAGLDFKSCNPTVLTTGNNTGFEGCATICDTSGDLLFYTNSDKVWNRFNVEMPNGNLISSGGTLSQVIIIPKPSSTTIFYIVTTRIQASGSLNLQYHVVDMSLNNGAGDVFSKNNVINTYNITEQVAATYHQNGTDIWLMVHDYGTINFIAYLVTSSGISTTPVFSSVGPAHVPCNSNINARGQIKFSPDGSKIAFNGNGVGGNDPSNILTLFDFDNATGIVSNPIDLPFSRGDFGLSFSPYNSKLYGTTWKAMNFTVGDYNYLYQFDLSSGNPTTIINSKQIIDSVPTTTVYSDIKIGPNGKIYVARNQSAYLGVINNPDQPGVACDYVFNGLYLDGKLCRFGLNNYIEYTTYCLPTGIENPNQENSSINIFQNSATGFTISFPQFIADGKIEIINLQGQIVLEKIIYQTSEEKIYLENANSGIYFLRFINSKSQHTIKFVVR